VQALSLQDLQAAMKRALVKSNRTVAMIVNPKSASSAGGQ
jgi:hypothetical protein